MFKIVSNAVRKVFGRKSKPTTKPSTTSTPSNKTPQHTNKKKTHSAKRQPSDQTPKEHSTDNKSPQHRPQQRKNKSHSNGNRDQHSSHHRGGRNNQSRHNNRPPRHRQENHEVVEIEETPRVIPPMPELVEVPEEEGKLRFSDLGLCKELLAGTQELGFKYCTPIQQLALPHAIEAKDVTGKAQTGTGKTAAFLLSIMNHMINNPLPKRYPGTARALILAPTRELAIQIGKDAENLGKFTNLNTLVVFGGMHHQKQRQALQKPVDLLIATPGRLIDYIKSRNLFLQDTEFLVIDEADRMLDMGFIPDVRYIVRQLPSPRQRRTMFFSATFDQRILRLVNSWLHNPVNVEVEAEEMVTDLIDQKFYSVMAKDKLNLLSNLLKQEPDARLIIFVNRKDTGYSLHKSLLKREFPAELLSGDVPQHKRMKIIENLRSGENRILIATDVAARGIHIKGISHVINYDLPEKSEDYVHRIGRTGRAGQSGKSISLVCESGAYVLGDIEKYLGEEISCELPPEELT